VTLRSSAAAPASTAVSRSEERTALKFSSLTGLSQRGCSGSSPQCVNPLGKRELTDKDYLGSTVLADISRVRHEESWWVNVVVQSEIAQTQVNN
jgi:hypothetical protein